MPGLSFPFTGTKTVFTCPFFIHFFQWAFGAQVNWLYFIEKIFLNLIPEQEALYFNPFLINNSFFFIITVLMWMTPGSQMQSEMQMLDLRYRICPFVGNHFYIVPIRNMKYHLNPHLAIHPLVVVNRK